MGDIVIEEANYKAFAIGLGSLFMLIASIAVMVYGIKKNRMHLILLGILAALIPP